MLKEIIKRRRSVVLTWLISYLTMLLLPLIISIFVYAISSQTLKSEIHQANDALLSQVREVMDDHFLSMQRLNFELTWNLRVQELLYSNKYLAHPEEYNYDLYQISQDMKPYESAYTQIDLFYLYVKSSGMAILPGRVRDGSSAYDLVHASSTFSYDRWKSIVNQKNFRGFLPMVRNLNGEVRKTVAYFSNYSLNSNDSPAANVIMIDQSRILGAIDNVELFNQGHVFILNEQNDLLVSNSEDALTSSIPLSQMTATTGLIYSTIHGEKFEVLYMTSARSGLKYISMIPSSLYWKKAESVRNLTIASSLLSLCGGVLLATFFLRRNYHPLQRLVEAFSGKSEVGYGRGNNEFQFIQQTFDSTLTKMDTLMTKMGQQRHILRNNFLSRLLKGRLDSQIPVDESLATFDIQFKSDQFAVILMYLENDSPFFQRVEGFHEEGKRKLLQFIVTNILEEIAGKRNQGYVMEIDEALACLINFCPLNEEERKEDLLRISREAQQFLAEHYHIHLTFSISAVHNQIEHIFQCYLEALDAMEYKLVMGSKEILSYEKIRLQNAGKSEFGYYYPLQVEQQLINYLKIGNFDHAKQTLDEIIEGNFQSPGVTIAFARCLMLNLVSTMIKAVSEIGSVQESFLVQNPKWIEQLAACESIQDMHEQMIAFFKTVCEYTSSKRQLKIQMTRQESLNDLIARVKAYIQERYKDANLNISMIGNHFDMKPTYLSKLFKDHTGEGLLDTINKMRIERAKHLITEKNKNINEVAGCVGFNDVNAFIRTFKKYEGTTPGKFKEISA
jgi:two-component system response regulator YesN